MPTNEKDLDEALKHLRKNPKRALEISERYVSEHPDDPNGLFRRFQALDTLGENAKALTDINRVIELEPNHGGFSVRGDFFRRIGEYQRGLDDLTRARQLDEDNWKTSLAPISRADCYANLGRLDEALADCVHIPDNWWMPEFNKYPGGNKQEITEEIRRRALAARKANKK